MIDTLLLYLPNNIFGLILLVTAFVVGLMVLFFIQKSQWLIYLLLIWFPLESLILMYAPIEYYAYIKYLPEVLLYGLTIGSFMHYVHHKKKILPRRVPFTHWLIGFLIIAGISLVVNWYSPMIWVLGMRQLLRFVLVVYVIAWMNYDKTVLKNIVLLGAGMMGLEIVLGIIQYLAHGTLDAYLFSSAGVAIGNFAYVSELEQFWTSGSRLFATLGRYDRLGSFLALGLIMLYPWMYQLKTYRQKLWFWVVAFLGLFVLFFTLSRASWIAAVVGIVYIAWRLHHDKRILTVFGVGCAMVCVYLGGFALTHNNVTSITERPNQSIAERVFEAVSLQAWRDSYEGYGRIFFIINTPRMVVWHFPLFGVGPGQYGGGVAAALLHTDMYDRLHLPFGIQNVYGQIDNNWMSIWGEMGTLGLIAFIGLFVVVIRMSLYVRAHTHDDNMRLIAEGLTGATIGVMILGFFGPYFEIRALMFYYWILVGIMVLEYYQVKNRGNLLQ